MKKYKVVHWNGGNIDTTYVEARDSEHARYVYFMEHNTGDIISIEEVTS